MAILIAPSGWRTIVGHLGIRDLADSGQVAHCPFCRQGRIIFFTDSESGRRYCSACCGLAGSLYDLVSRLASVPVDQARLWLAEHVPEARLDLASTDKRSVRADLLSRIWQQCGSLRQLFGARQFYDQIQLGDLDYDPAGRNGSVGIEQQIKACLASHLEPFWSELLPAEREFLRERTEENRLWFVMAGYRFPDRIVSLLFCRFVAKGKVESMVLLEEPDSQDAGIVIHPETAVRNRNVVATDQLAWYLRASFWHDRSCRTTNPMVYCFTEPTVQSHSIQMLLTRNRLIWTPALTAGSLGLAARLSGAVTHFGVDHGALNRRALRVLHAQRLFDELVERAEPWPRRFSELARKISLVELEALVARAGLGQSQLLEVADELPVSLACQLRTLDRAQCPVRQVSSPDGILEQSSAGWRLINRKGTELLSNYPWRLVGSVFHLVPCCQIEVHQQGAWQTVMVPAARLHRNPVRALSVAMAEAGLLPLVGSARYSKQMLVYAELLNPGSERKIESGPPGLGFDFRTATLRTSQLEISADPARLRSVKFLPERPGLLARADLVLPDRHAVSSLVAHQGVWHVVNAVAHQALRYLTGHRPLAVWFGEQSCRIVLSVLDGLELLDPRSCWPCDLSRISGRIGARLPRGTCDSELGIWLAASSRQACWLAGLRPVLHATDRNFEDPRIHGRDLQRALVQVLHRALLVLARSSVAHQAALESGWRSLLEQSGNRHTVLPVINSPMTELDAVLHWTRLAIRAGYFSVSKRQLVRPTAKMVVEGKSAVTIPLSGLNSFLVQNQFARWDLVKLLSDIRTDHRSTGHLIRNRRLYVQIDRRQAGDLGVQDFGNADPHEDQRSEEPEPLSA
jgi:hypothetical protein